MARHDPRERRLFRDLSEKNRLAGEFRRLSSRARHWRARLGRRPGKRWQAQYRNALRRAEERLATLRAEVLARAEELKARIQEEQEFSKAEVKKFEEQYAKEIAELKEARQAAEAAREAVSEARAAARETEQDAAVLSELRRKSWNAARELRRESGDLKRVEQELDSEERDKAVLTYELRRIVAEIESLRG
jgi:DNA repair exonuclease SbcCD ATPase subunit